MERGKWRCHESKQLCLLRSDYRIGFLFAYLLLVAKQTGLEPAHPFGLLTV